MSTSTVPANAAAPIPVMRSSDADPGVALTTTSLSATAVSSVVTGKPREPLAAGSLDPNVIPWPAADHRRARVCPTRPVPRMPICMVASQVQSSSPP